MLMLDIMMMSFMFMVVLMVLCGVFSLCERKILALVQLRMGPGLFLFGILTPITDGMKLFLKFMLFMMSFDMLYFIIALYMTACTMYFTWFFMPLGYIMLFDMNFTLLLMLCLHMMNNVFSIFLMGCFLFTSCFMYLAAMRALFFSMIAEASMSLSLYVFYVLDYFSFFSMKDMAMTQIFINNMFIMGIFFFFIFIINNLLDSLRMPFDYLECESELVAGIVTEFSGFFFVLYSLMEMNHMLLNSLLMTTLIFGGFYMTLKSLLMLMFIFLFPSAFGCSLKMTTAQTFMLTFLYTMNFLFFIWVSMTKVLTLMN